MFVYAIVCFRYRLDRHSGQCSCECVLCMNVIRHIQNATRTLFRYPTTSSNMRIVLRPQLLHLSKMHSIAATLPTQRHIPTLFLNLDVSWHPIPIHHTNWACFETNTCPPQFFFQVLTSLLYVGWLDVRRLCMHYETCRIGLITCMVVG